MKPQFADISPVVYGVRPFLDTAGAAPKTQYAYRLIGVIGGKAVCTKGDTDESLETGSVLYLCPGDMLGISARSSDFDAVEVFFDFLPYRTGLSRSSGDSVCDEQFNPLLCSNAVSFDDAPLFGAPGVFRSPETLTLLAAMLRYDPNGAFTDIAFRGLISAALATLVCGTSANGAGRRAHTAADIIAYINSHIDAELTPHGVAAVFGFHVNYANSLVKAQTGMPLGRYIKESKIRVADRLLAEGTLTLSQIAERLGYFDYSHFYKAYRSVTGSSPVRNGETVTDAANRQFPGGR